jgi:regulator of protease activity HflC (stomatin/prohibitin superfamily)
MSNAFTTRLNAIALALRGAFGSTAARIQPAVAGLHLGTVVTLGLIGGGAWVLANHPPLHTVAPGDVAIRVNQVTGNASEFHAGTVMVLPGLHEIKIFSLRDQVYRAEQGAKANGEAPFQSVEGLSLGVDLSIRYAIDPARVVAVSRNLPDDIGGQVVRPVVEGVIYKVFTRYTVREIFSTKRGEIQQIIEAELKPRLAADGVLLRGVQLGKVDLPADYRRGMDALLAEGLATEKMRYTLELKEKRIKETELEAEADRVRREKSATAAGNEQVIAARALEAEAEKQARVRAAEGSAQARRIEAGGEAESRQKLADAEVYRLERVGKTASEQMARDGALITRHPLLIQKTMADKLSDKITVIIAPPGTNGGFLGANLIGGGPPRNVEATVQGSRDEEAGDDVKEGK